MQQRPPSGLTVLCRVFVARLHPCFRRGRLSTPSTSRRGTNSVRFNALVNIGDGHLCADGRKSIPMSRQPNPGIMTSRRGKTTVVREQRGVERLRQCDVDGVVCR
jgi:hypothetical protein